MTGKLGQDGTEHRADPLFSGFYRVQEVPGAGSLCHPKQAE
jgi:hypothetical protein